VRAAKSTGKKPRRKAVPRKTPAAAS